MIGSEIVFFFVKFLAILTFLTTVIFLLLYINRADKKLNSKVILWNTYNCLEGCSQTQTESLWKHSDQHPNAKKSDKAIPVQ